MQIGRRSFTRIPSTAVVAAPFAAHAGEGYPTRPVRPIVPTGGGVDTFGRTVQPALGARLGQSIVIENNGGGSGRIGTQTASRAVADGYTLLLVNDTFAATEALPIASTPPAAQVGVRALHPGDLGAPRPADPGSHCREHRCRDRDLCRRRQIVAGD